MMCFWRHLIFLFVGMYMPTCTWCNADELKVIFWCILASPSLKLTFSHLFQFVFRNLFLVIEINLENGIVTYADNEGLECCKASCSKTEGNWFSWCRENEQRNYCSEFGHLLFISWCRRLISFNGTVLNLDFCYQCRRKVVVAQWLVKVVMAVYKGARIEVRIAEGGSKTFEVKLRLHNGFVLSSAVCEIVEVIKNYGKVCLGSYCVWKTWSWWLSNENLCEKDREMEIWNGS